MALVVARVREWGHFYFQLVFYNFPFQRKKTKAEVLVESGDVGGGGGGHGEGDGGEAQADPLPAGEDEIKG